MLKKYAHNKTDIYIVIESIYSMDGDMSPLLAIIELKKQYQATLIVDEAHSIGLYGNGGNGWVNQHSGLDDVDVMLLAFGKSFGLSGAMLVSNQEIVQRMKAKCRSYIYSTALPLPIASGIKKFLNQSVEFLAWYEITRSLLGSVISGNGKSGIII